MSETCYDAYEGEIGVLIQLETGNDMTGATSIKIRASKPGPACVEWTATAVDGEDTNSMAQYTTIAGDLIEGTYEVMVHVTATNGEWFGDPFTFTVGPTVCTP